MKTSNWILRSLLPLFLLISAGLELIAADNFTPTGAMTFYRSSHTATLAPPAISARADAIPLRARPNTATFWPRYMLTGIIPGAYRSFSVDKPINASTTAIIQNRMTTVCSFQPNCSKW